MPTPLLLLAPAVAFAAKAGSIKDLDKHNGFRDLALTQRCDDVPEFKGNNSSSACGHAPDRQGALRRDDCLPAPG